MCPGLLWADFPCLLHPPWDTYIPFPDPSQGATPKFPPSSRSYVICTSFLAIEEALLVAVVTEGEKCVKALLKKAEVTFTRSSDTVIGDTIWKCIYGLFLQTVVRAWTVLTAFSFWIASRAPENYHSVWKDRYLCHDCKAFWAYLGGISPCYVFFQEICTHLAQFNSRRPYTRRGCSLHKSTIFLSRYVTEIDIPKHSSLQRDIIFDTGDRESKSMTVKLV